MVTASLVHHNVHTVDAVPLAPSFSRWDRLECQATVCTLPPSRHSLLFAATTIAYTPVSVFIWSFHRALFSVLYFVSPRISFRLCSWPFLPSTDSPSIQIRCRQLVWYCEDCRQPMSANAKAKHVEVCANLWLRVPCWTGAPLSKYLRLCILCCELWMPDCVMCCILSPRGCICVHVWWRAIDICVARLHTKARCALAASLR